MPRTKADHWKRGKEREKISCTHGILLPNKELAELKNLMLRSDDVEEESDYLSMDGEDNYEVTEE